MNWNIKYKQLNLKQDIIKLCLHSTENPIPPVLSSSFQPTSPIPTNTKSTQSQTYSTSTRSTASQAFSTSKRSTVSQASFKSTIAVTTPYYTGT